MTSTTVSILEHHASDDPRYLNRELSWLQFDERVLSMAADPAVPLLERTRFLAIFQANLDEFFQVRVAGLAEQRDAHVGSAPDGMTPAQQLAAIRTVVEMLTTRQSELFHDELLPALSAAGIEFVHVSSLDDTDRAFVADFFERRVFPVLTPLAVDPAHPFPYISNLSLNLAVVVRTRDSGVTHFARVKVPPILPRFVALPDGARILLLEQIIADQLPRLFPGLDVVEHHAFRVLRNADFEVEEDADDLLDAIASTIARRRFGRVVRLEVEPDMTREVLDLITRELEVDDDAVTTLPGPLDLRGLFALGDLPRPDLRYPTFVPTTQPVLTPDVGEHVDLFALLRERDVLVHHPYESFETSTQAFIHQAAHDPQVMAIKQTLYRTSGRGSTIVQSLVEAAENGKQVVALVELKARFDEEANIEWARTLEEAGVHVAYGVVGLKTHTKISLVVRDEHDGIRRYAHVGTGNYNDRTARIYEDIGLLTADEDVGQDLTDLFNVLTGYSRQASYRRLVVAPVNFRRRMLDLIEREASHDDGHVVAKMNSLVDDQIIDALYDASNRGTRIDLVVRGICCLRPGVSGRSANIRVRSIVGRYLEHSRIYRFGSPERGFDHLIGSGDWMPRNLDRRVEVLTVVDDPRLQDRLEEILGVMLDDRTVAWELGPDSVWRRHAPDDGREAHDVLQERAERRGAR